MRVVSGKYEKGMKLRRVRTGKDVVISGRVNFMAGDRSHVERSVPGRYLVCITTAPFRLAIPSPGRDDEAVYRYPELCAGTVLVVFA